MWIREPFNGGCLYLNEELNLTVTGFYDAPDFEADCKAWEASNLPDQVFPTAEEAIDAAMATAR